MQQERKARFEATIAKLREAKDEVYSFYNEAIDARDSFDEDTNPEEFEKLDGIVSDLDDEESNIGAVIDTLERIVADED